MQDLERLSSLAPDAFGGEVDAACHFAAWELVVQVDWNGCALLERVCVCGLRELHLRHVFWDLLTLLSRSFHRSVVSLIVQRTDQALARDASWLWVQDSDVRDVLDGVVVVAGLMITARVRQCEGAGIGGRRGEACGGRYEV